MNNAQTVYLQNKTIFLSLVCGFLICVILITLALMALFNRAHCVDGCCEDSIREISLFNVYAHGYRRGSLLQWGCWEFCSNGSSQAYLFSNWRIKGNLAPRREDRGAMITAIKYFRACHLEKIEHAVGRPDWEQVVFIKGFSIAQNAWRTAWGMEAGPSSIVHL